MRWCLLLLLLVVRDRGVRGRSQVYQRDVSEHCRRRALPSVFLGKRVVETNAQIMHFSRLELPYNCFIAVRAETGANIILVVHLAPDDNLMASCENEGDQLTVYEMAETFGGYWGQLPVDYMRNSNAELQKIPLKYYTLKTRLKATTTTTELSTTAEMTTVERLSNKDKTRVQQQVWTDVVPLLNLSVQFAPSDTEVRHRINSDDAFDAFYDVTPVPGVQYETSVVPLVQFSMSALKGDRRDGSDGSAPLFDLVYDEKFSSVTRSTSLHFIDRNPMRKHKTTAKIDYFRPFNRSYESVLNNKMDSRQSQQRSKMISNKVVSKFQYNQNQLSSNDLSTEAMGRNETTAQDSWLYVMDLINILKNSTSTPDEQLSKRNDKQSELLRMISQMNHNRSVYLEPDLDMYTKEHEEKMHYTVDSQLNNVTGTQITIRQLSEIEFEHPSLTEEYSGTKNGTVDFPSQFQNTSGTIAATSGNYVNTTNSNGSNTFVNLIRLNYTNEEVHSEGANFVATRSPLSPTDTAETSSKGPTIVIKPITGALVGHESWENVVNVAPKMEMVLNNTRQRLKQNISTKPNRRRKRNVQAVEVQNSKPHRMVQRLVTTTRSSLHADMKMYGFSPVVEPQDDEIYGRAHLRYVRRFIGPVIFNLCNYTKNEPKFRQVLLFNSSRILIAISNFTIKRMTLVLTAARSLGSVASRCPTRHLECQVSGARVCIDSSSACDGVPNCGAYDIYDEDRLTCGAGRGLQHNVYLAAFTFLAVLMTVCYSVHYWLKRCVPQVSEAFFVYTNGVENILYLNTIMKSPTDADDLSKMFYHGQMVEDDYLQENTDRRSTVRKLIDRISVFFQKKPEVTLDSPKRESRFESKMMYSFTELELNRFSFKMTTDTSMQTGESLEMQTYNRDLQTNAPNPKQKAVEVRNAVGAIQEGDYVPELSEVTSTIELKRDLRAIKLCKYLREARGSSQESPSGGRAAATDLSDTRSASDERELCNLLYDFPVKDSFGSLKVAYDPNEIEARTTSPAPDTGSTQKRLRFEEAATVIPSAVYETDDPPDPSLVPGAGGLESSGEVSGIDFMRFWNIKPKKPKNKGHVSLREK